MSQFDFNEITQTRVPGAYCEIDNSLANRGLPGKPSAGLLIGQKLAGLLEYNKISGQITSADQVIPLAGEGSELHRMAESWFKNNKQSKLYIIAVEQTEGTAAVYHLAIAATKVQAGMLNLMIGGREIRLTINEGDTAADITTALIAKINANVMLPVTAAAVSEKDTEINLTAKHIQSLQQSFDNNAEPGGLVLVSRIHSAILSTINLVDYKLVAPTENIQCAAGEIAMLGDVTWS